MNILPPFMKERNNTRVQLLWIQIWFEVTCFKFPWMKTWPISKITRALCVIHVFPKKLDQINTFHHCFWFHEKNTNVLSKTIHTLSVLNTYVRKRKILVKNNPFFCNCRHRAWVEQQNDIQRTDSCQAVMVWNKTQMWIVECCEKTRMRNKRKIVLTKWRKW